jgi:hypothetical protein
MKTIKLGIGDYNITRPIEIPDLDTRLLGEKGVRLVPEISPCVYSLGPEKYYCKNCSTLLVAAIFRHQIEKIIIVCSTCKTENPF